MANIKKENSIKYIEAMDRKREEQKKFFFDYCEELNGGNIDLSKFKYKGNRVKGLCKCNVCGHEWMDTPELLRKRKMCPECHKKNKIFKNREETLNRYNEKAKKIYENKNISDIKFYFNEKDELTVQFYCHEKYCDGIEHGLQIQTGFYFLNGNGCSKCSAQPSKSYTTEEWVRIAKSKFPELGYDKVKYINKETKVFLTCPIHGEFSIVPRELIGGRLYCPQCTKERKRKEKENRFIEKSKVIHNNKYIYSNVYYENSGKKVCIICPDHGEFLVTPTNHMHGVDCPKCAVEKLKEINNKKKEDFAKFFIEQSKEIHGNKYIYDKVVYTGNEKKVIITCPIHGDFEQTPHAHLYGHGCPKCGFKQKGESTRMSQEEFLERVKEVHKNKGYDFSKVVYRTTNDKVTVVCPKHGEFSTKAVYLLRGYGCPICKMPKLEIAVLNSLIENKIKHARQKRFKSWLGGQSLDFFIPEKNIAIECQGLQHFKNERRYKKLEEVQERDERKKRLCIENGVHLIYYVPEIFSSQMKEDDIFFTNTEELIEYIKKYKYK